ncbi:MAG: hypothetical protein ACFB22_13815 [Rhodothalassiaceae bacterium]
MPDEPVVPYNLSPDKGAFFASEKRLHIRAFRYWESLLNGRDFPSLQDMTPDALADFKLNSAVISLAGDQPQLVSVGAKLSAASGGEFVTVSPATVPQESLLGQVLRHWPAVLQDRRPVGLDAFLPLPDGVDLPFRGILLPLSDDGCTIHFVLAVISWKESLLKGQDGDSVEDPPQSVLGQTVDPAAMPEVTLSALSDLPPLAADDPAWAHPSRPFELVLARRLANGRLAPVRVLSEPQDVIEAAVRRAAEQLASDGRDGA